MLVGYLSLTGSQTLACATRQRLKWQRCMQMSPCVNMIQRSVHSQGQKSRRWYEIKMRASLAVTPKVAVMCLLHMLALLADRACLQGAMD